MSVSNLLQSNNYALKCASIETSGSHGGGSVEIGPGASATGLDSIAIGKDTTASGTGSCAIMPNATAAGEYGLALGVLSSAPNQQDISIGNTAGNTNTAGLGVVSLAGIPAPSAAAAKASTHEVPININGTVYNFLVSNV